MVFIIASGGSARPWVGGYPAQPPFLVCPPFEHESNRGLLGFVAWNKDDVVLASLELSALKDERLAVDHDRIVTVVYDEPVVPER